MSIPFIRRCVCVLLLALASMQAPAQESVTHSPQAERLFQKGLSDYRDNRHAKAVQSFDSVARMSPMHQRTTAAHIMKAKSLLAQNDNLEATRTLKSFLASYSWSSYAGDANYMLGITQACIQRYDDAMNYWLKVFSQKPAVGGTLRRNTEKAIERVIDEHMSSGQVQSLIATNPQSDATALLWLKLAEKHAKSGNVALASVALDSVERQPNGKSYASRVSVLRAGLAERSTVRLGALLPLMKKSEPSAAKQIGNDVYDGVVFAVEEYQSDPGVRIKVILETRDTERDPSVAATGAKQLCSFGDLVAIIGPAFSHTTSAVSSIVNEMKVPLISPTANSNGLAATGPYMFQANPDYENRGKAIAKYAVTTKGFTTFAILAPSDANGKLLSESFGAEVTRLGGRVVAREWYGSGTTDFSTQLQNIRRAGERASVEPMISFAGRLNQGDLVKLIQLGVPAERLDSLVNKSATVPASFLLGPRGVFMIDSLELSSVKYHSTADSIEVEVTGIHAIYLPVSSSAEIGAVASQIVYFNIRTQLLGSGEWESLAELDASKRYCEGVLFESDSYVDRSGLAYLDFVERFSRRFGKQPGKNTMYGYDTARLVLSLIGNGASTREAFARALSSVHEYTGVHSRLSFADRRVNSWLHILQYGSDAIRLVEEIDVGGK